MIRHKEEEPAEENGSINVDTLLKLLIMAFGLWATVVGWGVARVTSELSDLGHQHRMFVEQFNQYVSSMEHRVTALEEYQKVQDAKRDRIESDLDKLKGDAPRSNGNGHPR